MTGSSQLLGQYDFPSHPYHIKIEERCSCA
jgi:hypothetical protein